MLDLGDIAAEVEVDAPEKIAEQEIRWSWSGRVNFNNKSELTDAKCGQLSHALPVLIVLHSLPDQLPRLSNHRDDHGGEHNLVNVDLVSYNVVSRDRDQHAEDGERVASALRWSGLKAEQLVEQRANSEEHGKVVTCESQTWLPPRPFNTFQEDAAIESLTYPSGCDT